MKAVKHFYFKPSKKMDVLNIEVSCFKNYVTPDNPRPVSLLTWLKSAKYRHQVEAIRSTEEKAKRDQLKAALPAITPSGLFRRREEKALLKHSGLIQFDIDLKENGHISNYSVLKKELCKIVNVAYVGLSVSGRGYWGLIPIANPMRHKAHFAALKEDFARFGIILDDKPGNVASLRGYSYDPGGLFNPDAKPYTRVKEKSQNKIYRRSTHSTLKEVDAEKIEAILSQIEAKRIDITAGGYRPWFEIAAALANEFGEAGRDYFHRISQFYSGYNSGECDRQFTACLRRPYRYTLGTVFDVALQYGIEYKEVFGYPKQRPFII